MVFVALGGWLFPFDRHEVGFSAYTRSMAEYDNQIMSQFYADHLQARLHALEVIYKELGEDNRDSRGLFGQRLISRMDHLKTFLAELAENGVTPGAEKTADL